MICWIVIKVLALKAGPNQTTTTTQKGQSEGQQLYLKLYLHNAILPLVCTEDNILLNYERNQNESTEFCRIQCFFSKNAKSLEIKRTYTFVT